MRLELERNRERARMWIALLGAPPSKERQDGVEQCSVVSVVSVPSVSISTSSGDCDCGSDCDGGGGCRGEYVCVSLVEG